MLASAKFKFIFVEAIDRETCPRFSNLDIRFIAINIGHKTYKTIRLYKAEKNNRLCNNPLKSIRPISLRNDKSQTANVVKT